MSEPESHPRPRKVEVGRTYRIQSSGTVLRVTRVGPMLAEHETGWSDLQREHYGAILHDQLVLAGAPLVVWQDTSPVWRDACGLAAEALWLLGRADL